MKATAPAARLGSLYVLPSLLGVMPPTDVLPQHTIDVARRLSHFVVETPKIARQFLKSLDPQRPLSSIAMAELNEHTAAYVLPAILSRLPYTAVLAVCGILVELALGLPLGLLSALRPGTASDRGALLGSLLFFSMPPCNSKA